MKRDIYTFPAILSFDDDGISVKFPDLPGCITCSETIEYAINNAKEVLGLHIYGLEKDNEFIPEATNINDLKLENNEMSVLIEVVMPTLNKTEL